MSDGSPAGSIVVAGDLCITGHWPTPEVEDAAVPWRELLGALERHDVRLVNVECPLTRSGTPIRKWGPNLAGDPRVAALVARGGFNVATLANNHIMDMGPEGLDSTLAACADAGLCTVGAGKDAAAAQAPLLLRAGARVIAVLAATEREFSIAGPRSPGAAPLDVGSLCGRIMRLSHDVDAVVVVLHGGVEHLAVPSPRLVSACRALVDAGAAAVVCHHSHVTGWWERWKDAPIVYGTGNFLFASVSADGPHAGLATDPAPWGTTPTAWRRGTLVSLQIDDAGCRIQRIAFEQDEHDGSVRLLSALEADAFLADLDTCSRSLADPDEHAEVWRAACVLRRAFYLSEGLGLTRVERRLLRGGRWPWWRLARRRAIALLNLYRCESHADVMAAILEEELLWERRRRPRPGEGPAAR